MQLTIPQMLIGQKALVTGSSSGIGKAVAIALAQAGAEVVVNYALGEAAAHAVVETIQAAGGRAMALQADVSQEDQVQAMFARMMKELGTIDILVNNSGVQKDAPLEGMTLAQWNGVLAVNLTGQFLCAREAVREFKRRGVVPEVSASAGKIICMSSVHEVIPWAGHVNYAASKGGVMLMSKKSGAWLVPVGLSARPCSFVKSWDRYMVPWFFSKAVFVFGEPIIVPPDADEDVLESKRVELEGAIKKIQAEADTMVGHL